MARLPREREGEGERETVQETEAGKGRAAGNGGRAGPPDVRKTRKKQEIREGPTRK